MDNKAEPFIEIHDIHSENNDRNMIRHIKIGCQSASIFVSGLFKSTTVDYECILHLVGAMWIIKLSHLLKYMTYIQKTMTGT